MGSRYLGLGIGGQWFLHHPVPAPTHPSPPLLTGSGPTSKLQALPHLASGRRNASSVVEGLQKNRCSVSRPFHSPRGGRRLSSPQEAGAGPELASGCQQGRGGALGRGRRALKASFGEALQLQAHHLPAPGHHVVPSSVPCPVPGRDR